MSLVRLLHKEEDLKGWVVMGIVDPVTKKLPHPQDGSFLQNRCFEPKTQKALKCSS